MLKLRISSVRDAVQSTLWGGAGRDLLRHLLRRGASVFVFAGAIRDLVLAKEYGFMDVEPRDWDIGVSGICPKEFGGVLREFDGVRNRYGGFKLFGSSSQPWEIWRQEETVGLLKTGTRFSLDALLRSFVLSANALACNFDSGVTFDCGALSSISKRKLTILNNAIMHDQEVFAAKALLLSLRRPLALEPRCASFVRRHLDSQHLMHEHFKTHPQLEVTVRAENEKICRRLT